jgi:general secretion pathway protein K
MAQLRPFLIVLPADASTLLNVNTVPTELLAAMFGMSLSDATRLVAVRKTAAWRTPADFVAQLPPNTQSAEGIYDVKSNWFIVQSRIRLDRAALNAEALIRRRDGVIGGGGTEVIWTRQN